MSYSKPQFNKRGGNDRNNWAQSRPQLQSEGILVQTNAFSLTVEKVVTIHQYLVQMISCRWVRHPETKANLGLKLNRKPIFSNTEASDSSHLTEKEKEDESKRNRSSDFSRRILNQLQQKLKPHQIFFPDGTNIAYSARPLQPQVDPSDPVLLADDTTDGNPPTKKLKPSESTDVVQYLVLVNVDSDESAALSCRREWFLVSFQLTNTFNYEESKKMQAALNTALRASLVQPPSLLWALGRSPNFFFFPPQYNVLPHFLQNKVHSAIMPMLGLKPSIRAIENAQSFLLLADYGLSYAYNDEGPGTTKAKKAMFPLLLVNGSSATLSGTDLRILDVNAVIPPAMRAEMKRSLLRRKFHLRYDKGPKNWQKLQAMQKQQIKLQQQAKTDYVSADVQEASAEKALPPKKPWTDAELEEKRYRTRRNVCLMDEDAIIWEPHSYTFPYAKRKPKEEAEEMPNEEQPEHITVAEYFWRHYEFRVRYPNMPLLRVPSRNKELKEYFPIEFFFQARAEMKGSNSEQQVRDALQLHDEFAGVKRIERVASLLQKVSPAENLQTQFKMALAAEPLTVSAKVLPEPRLYVSKQQPASIQDGSWKIPGGYIAPSTLASFAVIDYSGAGADSLWRNCFQDLFQRCRELGMVFPNEIKSERFTQVVVNGVWPPDPASIYKHFDLAILRARKEFLSGQKGVWDVHNFSGHVVPCTVDLEENAQVARVWPNDVPRSAPKEVPVEFVNCPSIVFVIFPEKHGVTYSNIKFFSNCEFSLQSQVLIWGKKRDRNYYANVALKLNTKLATSYGRSTAWRREENTWLEEALTMVIGLSTASSMGNDGKTTVVGTVCLDNTGLKMFQELRVQKKSPYIAEKAMVEIVQALGILFSSCNGNRIPERVVVYRLGGDDGMFEDIIGKEVSAIKKAFHELNFTMKDYSCSQCNSMGCVFCLPKITMVIAQHQHNLILAPRHPVPGLKNVPSGTCVEGLFAALSLSDDGKMRGLLSGMQESQKHAKCFSYPVKSNAFALVAHGGLKGTSKCVIYQWIWNENLIFPSKSSTSSPLTLDQLEKLTYFLSFQYGTANKAPRLPALLQYSARLNNVAIGYVHLRIDQGEKANSLRENEEDSMYCDMRGFGNVLRRPKADNGFGFVPFHPHFSA